MSTNPWFNNTMNRNEQNLIDDLVIEAISIYGVDTYYVTRNIQNVDRMFNEDRVSIFNAAYNLEMYISSVDGFGGEGDFLSRFGLQIRDQVTFVVAIRTFERNVIRNQPSIIRPNEGDLVWFPPAQEFFKIMHVEHESVFYQMGALQVYELQCEFFEYSSERFMTGIDDIDHHFDKYNIDNSHMPSLESLEHYDIPARNLTYQKAAEDIVDWSQVDPFTTSSDSVYPPSDYDTAADDDITTADDTVYTVDLDEEI